MNSEIKLSFLVFCVIATCSLIAFYIGVRHGMNELRLSAVRNGAAEWKKDVYGKPMFIWK